MNWKDFERRCAALIGGKRYPANMGGKVDVESDTIVGQCKEVRVMPLAELSRLVVQIEAEAKKVGKVGVVFVKSHEGRGFPTPPLVVMRMETWWEMLEKAKLDAWNSAIVEERGHWTECPHCRRPVSDKSVFAHSAGRPV